jgi:hypothetical protein
LTLIHDARHSSCPSLLTMLLLSLLRCSHCYQPLLRLTSAAAAAAAAAYHRCCC